MAKSGGVPLIGGGNAVPEYARAKPLMPENLSKALTMALDETAPNQLRLTSACLLIESLFGAVTYLSNVVEELKGEPDEAQAVPEEPGDNVDPALHSEGDGNFSLPGEEGEDVAGEGGELAPGADGRRPSPDSQAHEGHEAPNASSGGAEG